jgi:catechol 2,3-dioxygenase-like lactoylglutathione lyase family enzyme
MLRQLAMMTVLVPDYDSGIAFFCSVLGFTLIEDSQQPQGKRWVVVQAHPGGFRLLLAQATTSAQQVALGNQTGGRVGFFLETDDFDRDQSLLTAAGVRFRETPRSEPYGKVAVFADPFGNLWDLIEPSPSQKRQSAPNISASPSS